jgi:hypothetical protein
MQRAQFRAAAKNLEDTGNVSSSVSDLDGFALLHKADDTPIRDPFACYSERGGTYSAGQSGLP